MTNFKSDETFLSSYWLFLNVISKIRRQLESKYVSIIKITTDFFFNLVFNCYDRPKWTRLLLFLIWLEPPFMVHYLGQNYLVSFVVLTLIITTLKRGKEEWRRRVPWCCLLVNWIPNQGSFEPGVASQTADCVY